MIATATINSDDTLDIDGEAITDVSTVLSTVGQKSAKFTLYLNFQFSRFCAQKLLSVQTL